MIRTDLKKHAAAVLLMLCMLAACALPAFATSANIKLTDGKGNPMTGSIHITLYDIANNRTLSGGELTVYRVAEVQRHNGDLSYEYCGEFYGCGIELGDLSESGLASRLQEYMPAGTEGLTKAVDNNGYAVFDDLELGLYLVVQTKASSGYKPINSFLVSLPMAEDGQWNYEVDASPKVGAYTPEPDTPPVPPPDVPKTPDVPVTPPDKPATPSTPGTPAAPSLPGTPAAPAGSSTTTVVNHLPKTGQLNWPVPVMAVSGMLLFAYGWTLTRRRTTD